MKLFLLISFILCFTSFAFAQTIEPVTVNPNTANEVEKIGTDYYLGKINVEVYDGSEIDPNDPDSHLGGRFRKSRITIVSYITMPVANKSDPDTGFPFYEVVAKREEFSGTIQAYLDLLDAGVAAGKITEQVRDERKAGLIAIYQANFEGYKFTINLMKELNLIQLKAIKKVIPAN